MKALLKKYLGSDPVIWVVFGLLCVISIVEMYSSATSLVTSSVASGKSYNAQFLRHLTFLLGGFGCVFVMHYIPFKLVRLGGYFVLAVSILLLVITLINGTSVNDASRWTTIGGVEFQPSELAKLSIIIVVADLISRIREGAADQKRYFWIIMLIVVTVCGLIFLENFSTAALLFVVVLLMLFVGQISWKYLVGIVGVIVLGLFLGFSIIKTVPEESMPKVFHRAYTWVERLNDHSDDKEILIITDDNRQVVYGKLAVARGGVLGVMPGNSEMRNYLPGAFSDFIYAIIIEELGLVGGILVIILYLVLLYRAGRIATQSKTVFSTVIVIGLTLMIVIQAFIHMAVATNLGPVTGQPLPFISRGGTALIINCIYIGIILSATRQIRLEKETKQPKIENEN
jgi:Bacterial cell division membrane protein